MDLRSIFKYQYKGSVILSLLFGMGYAAGDIFVLRPGLNFNTVTILSGLFMSLLFYLLFSLIPPVLDFIAQKRPIRIIRKIREHTFLITFLILLILWAPHLIIKYPAGQCPDSIVQVQMGRGADTLSAHYPIVPTLLMGWFVNAGEKAGNVNAGMFLYVAIEAVIMAAVFAHVVSALDKKLHVPDAVLGLAILFFALSPYITGYVGQAIKDNYYSTGFVLVLMVFVQYCSRDKITRPGTITALIFGSVLAGLSRKEGIIVLAVIFLLITIMEISAERRLTKTLPILLAALLTPVLINHAFELKYKPEKASYAEMLSIPFQQTARYVSKHQDIISEEEKEAISRILAYDELPKIYYPPISDNVKTTFNEDATGEDMINYLKAWFTGLKKAPLCYLRATAEQNIYLIYFGVNNHSYYVDANSPAAYLYGDSRLFTTPGPILALQDEYLSFLEDMHSFPVLSFINNLPFYVWILMGSTIIAAKRKNRLFLYVSIPLYLSLLIIICAPQILAAVRYASPIIWSFPIWLSCICIRPAICS